MTMKKYTIWNCLSKKEENKEIKVFVPYWVNVEDYENNKFLTFVKEITTKPKTLQTIEGVFNVSVVNKTSYTYLKFNQIKGQKTKISLHDYFESLKENFIKSINEKTNSCFKYNTENGLIEYNEVNEDLNLNKPDYSNKATSNNEYAVLKRSINYYLDALNLELLEASTIEHEELQTIARFGDALFDVDLMREMKKNGITSPSVKTHFSTNENMTNALIRLGFYELTSSNVAIHYAGSLFEAIYWIAYKQGNFEIRKKLFETVTNLNLSKEAIYYI